MAFSDPHFVTDAQILSYVADHFTDISWPSVRRLKGGRTSAVFAVGTSNERPRFVVKVTQDGRDTPLFENRPRDEWRLLCQLSPFGLSPMPVSQSVTSNGLHVLSYHFVHGTLGAVTPTALAETLRQVHHRTAPAWLVARATQPADLLQQSESLLLAPLPDWAKKLQPRGPSEVVPNALGLIHCDPIAKNIVTTSAGRAILLDWQCPALGDPVEDIAHATSPAMAHAYGDPRPFDVWDILDRYDDQMVFDRAGVMLPFYRWRMLCYCHWQTLQGSERHAAAMELEAEALDSLNSQS